MFFFFCFLLQLELRKMIANSSTRMNSNKKSNLCNVNIISIHKQHIHIKCWLVDSIFADMYPQHNHSGHNGLRRQLWHAANRRTDTRRNVSEAWITSGILEYHAVHGAFFSYFIFMHFKLTVSIIIIRHRWNVVEWNHRSNGFPIHRTPVAVYWSIMNALP